MSAPFRIWLEVAHHAAFRIGGWAFVRQGAGQLSGTAGGERRIEAERAGLAALAAALADLPPGASVELNSASPLVLAIPRRIAQAAADPSTAPTENLDLWARASTALARPGLVVRRSEVIAGAPAAFAAAWAELARDRAKDKGPFTAAIPKPNLAKAGV
jgi:ribonuclease HI